MNVLSTDTLAVPDSAFPYAMTSELAGLLDGPASPEEDALEGLKLSSLRGDGSYTPDYYTQLPYAPDCYPSLDMEWMCKNTLLLTPQEQGTDVLGFHPPPAAPYTFQNPFTSLPTPDSSFPPSPESPQCQDPDVLSALSLFDSDADSKPSQPADVLPQFDVRSPLSSPASYNHNPSPLAYSSPDSYDFPQASFDPTPSATCLHSPLPPTPQGFSLDASYAYTTCAYVDSSLPSSPCNEPENSETIRDLLVVKVEPGETPSRGGATDSRKRKPAPAAVASGDGVKGKRRKFSKATKKERKKEQNKQAALRYRYRKREESGEVEEKKEQLEAINSSLKSQVTALSAEISYLKKLWLEVHEAKSRKLGAQTRQ